MELKELPGSKSILPGLEDLHQGRNKTIEVTTQAVGQERSDRP